MADRRLKIAKFPILALASIAGFGFGLPCTALYSM